MTVLRYKAPRVRRSGSLLLIASEGKVQERRFVFFDRIEIGRLQEGEPVEEGRLLIADPTVSRHHCTIIREEDGHCYLRDTSRNGTRLDGHLLMPNREVGIRSGQRITVGSEETFRFIEPEHPAGTLLPLKIATMPAPTTETVSVVVGDIRSYTSLIQSVPAVDLQTAVSRVFTRLKRAVLALGGEVKEYQGDSLMAFWESVSEVSPAVSACAGVLELHRLVQELAEDREVWGFPEFSLRMDWAVATGSVTVFVLGEDRPEELSMVGKPVVLAYRLEKAADKRTGPIVVCEKTRTAAEDLFAFRDLGNFSLDGFDCGVRAYALLGKRIDKDLGSAPTLSGEEVTP